MVDRVPRNLLNRPGRPVCCSRGTGYHHAVVTCLGKLSAPDHRPGDHGAFFPMARRGPPAGSEYGYFRAMPPATRNQTALVAINLWASTEKAKT